MSSQADPWAEVSARDVADLGKDGFTALCNDLLEVERLLNHESADATSVTENIDAPDGGVDALSDFQHSSSFAPHGRTVWQYKSGKVTPSDLAKEIRKRDQSSLLISEISAGASYKVLIAYDYSATQVAQREEAIRKELREKGVQNPSVAVRNSKIIAQWASYHPAIVAKHFRRLPPGFETIDQRLAMPQHGIGFRSDRQRSDLVQRIQDQFSDPNGERHIRITGPAGIGKSRVALEALRNWDKFTLYARTAPSSAAFGRDLVLSNKSAFLILDECNHELATEWAGVIEQAEGRVRLLTVDTTDIVTPRDTIHLSGLDEKELAAIAQEAAPVLTESQTRWVARICEGFVKFAIEVAVARAQAPDAAVGQLIESGNIPAILESLFKEKEERQVMASLALFTRVGYREKLQHEAKAIAQYFNIRWQDFNDVAERMIERGLLSPRGRYVYVTPMLLAVWLAAEQLRSSHDDILKVQGVPDAERFWRRIGQMQGSISAEGLASRILGASDRFRTMEDMNSEEASRLVFELAKVAPHAGAELLGRLTREVSLHELQSMTWGRRYQVWTLEHLAERADTFKLAASALLRLATAENESYGNNATGTFKGLFQTILGRTVVPAPERLNFLDRVLSQASDEEAIIAIEALGSALLTSETGSPLGVHTEGDAPPEGWRPKTWGEYRAIQRQAFDILLRQMQMEDAGRRKAAAHVFLKRLRSLVDLGLGPEARVALTRLEQDSAAVDERELIAEIGLFVEYDLNKIEETERSAWNEIATRVLAGSFHRRMLALVHSWDPPSHLIRERQDLQAAIHELASQAVADPGLLEDELRWLCGHEQVPNITEFGRALGEQDRHGSLTDKLIEATALNGDARLLANYAGGRSLAEMELETLLDRIEERAYGYLAQLLLLLPYRPSIKDRYMRLLADSPDALSTLDSTPVIWMAREMTDSEVVELLEPLIERSTAGSRWVALAILEERIQSGKDMSFVETAWRVLEQHGDYAPHGTLVEHLWSEIAKEIASQDPTRMLGILLDHAEDAEDDPSQFTYSQQASVLLDVLAKAGPIDWETFIRRVTGEPRLRLSFSWWGQEKALLERVPLKTLQEWAGDSADRLEQIAMFAKPGDQLTPVIVWLIEQAGPVSDAARRLRMHMRSGVFSGSQENRERGFLTLFEKWAVTASSPALREWAEEGAEETRQWLPRIQQRENEYDWD